MSLHTYGRMLISDITNEDLAQLYYRCDDKGVYWPLLVTWVSQNVSSGMSDLIDRRIQDRIDASWANKYGRIWTL